MSKYSKERLLEIDSEITAYLVKSPKSGQSLRAIARTIGYSKDFIAVRLQEIRYNRRNRMDTEELKEWLAQFQDMIDHINLQLWRILEDPNALNRDKIRASNSLVNNNKIMLEKMIDSDIFNKLKTDKFIENIRKGSFDPFSS